MGRHSGICSRFDCKEPTYSTGHDYCREHRLKKRRKKLGISDGEYWKLVKKQKGLCAICKQPEVMVRLGRVVTLSIDHDHKTNTVRGLLCHRCNVGLGHFLDNPKLLKKAAKYLQGR